MLKSVDDVRLLELFCREGSQDAFAELVRRHIDMVYASAMRQVRDPATAEDVVQGTFIILAGKARRLGATVVISSWLLNTTRFVAMDALKARRRRTRHEQVAGLERVGRMNPDTQEPRWTAGAGRPGAGPSAAGTGFDEVVDRALGRLGRAARDVLVLRYFRNQSFSEMADQLHITEPAARKRLSRALGQLRQVLRRWGVNMEVDAIAPSLVAVASLTTPPGLWQSVASGTLQSKASPLAVACARGAMRQMLRVKLWTALTGVAAAGAVVGGGVAVTHLAAHRLTTGSPAARLIAFDGAPAADDKLAPVVGSARTPDGAPVAGAEVLLSSANETPAIYGQGVRGADAYTTTGPDGKFEVHPTHAPLAVLVRNAKGAGIAAVSTDRRPIQVTVQPWGRVKGTVYHGKTPVAGARVALSHLTIDWRWHVNAYRTILADEQGNFDIPRVLSGDVYLGWQPEGENSVTHWQHCAVTGAGVINVTLGGSGREIVGSVVGNLAGKDVRNGYLDPQPPIQLEFAAQWDKLASGWGKMTGAERTRRWEELKQSPQFPAWQLEAQPYMFRVNGDGTFSVSDIPEGRYRLRIECGAHQPGSDSIEWTDRINVPLAVSGSQAGDQPLDVGRLNLVTRQSLRVGQTAPPISGKDAAGKPIALSDSRGKYTLLNLWSSDRADTVETMKALRDAYDRFGGDVAMVGVNLDESQADAQRVLARTATPWRQIFVGKSWDALPEGYDTLAGNVILLDPEGKLVAKNFEPSKAMQLLAALPHREVSR